MFSTVEIALETVKQYTQIAPDDSSHDVLLTALLEASTGKLKTTLATEYRPFYVATQFLKINPLNDGVQKMTGTDTVEFQDPTLVIKGLMDMQKELDKALTDITADFTTNLHRFSSMSV